mgnify:CR=1 FL=1
MTKFILFLDGEMKGYLNDEQTAKTAVSELADHLITSLKASGSEDSRIFRENVESGIKIYSQALGTYFNGTVNIHHFITWKPIQQYKRE